MSIDSFKMLFDEGIQYMTGTTASSHNQTVHPLVELISIPFAAGNPVYILMYYVSYLFPGIGYLVALAILISRFGLLWVAHYYLFLWWSFVLWFLSSFFWVWVLDAWGWIQTEWFWKMVAP